MGKPTKSQLICDLLLHCCRSVKELQNNYRCVDQWADAINKVCSSDIIKNIGGCVTAGSLNHAIQRHPSLKHIVNNLKESNDTGVYICIHNRQHYVYASSNCSRLPPQGFDWRSLITSSLPGSFLRRYGTKRIDSINVKNVSKDTSFQVNV